MPNRTFLEFFAGGGMARAGLGAGWRCLLANDFDPAKCAAYRVNFGGGHLIECDVASLTADALPSSRADLAWASFPCQDLSLAGARAGLAGGRSGAFFGFWRAIEMLAARGRAPRAVVIENVTGLLSSNGGRDFALVADRLAGAGYYASALVIDARAFTPQSRPRVFLFGLPGTAPFSPAPPSPAPETPAALLAAVAALPEPVAARWRWLAPRPSSGRNADLADIIDRDDPQWSAAEGRRARALMSPRQRAALDALIASGETRIGAGFRRIRTEKGVRVQRFEARFDGLAGCLRTPAGGSSRQMVLKVEAGRVCARRMSPREAARLMGLADDYRLPARATAALKLLGDGVCAPAVRWIAEAILEPALAARRAAA